jgi:hypothetical protein
MKITIIAVILLSVLAQAQQAHPVVFINGEGGTHVSGGSVAKHDETMEMARVLLKSCPELSLTTDGATTDYSLLLNREEEHFGGAVSQVMVLRPDKSVMFASKQGTVARAVRDGCKAILADWKERRPARANAPLWNKQNN